MIFKISSYYFISRVLNLALKLQLSLKNKLKQVLFGLVLAVCWNGRKLKLLFDKVVQDIIVTLNVITKCVSDTPYLVLWVL